MKKTTGIILSVVLGLTFLYSGYTKLLPLVETFEFTFVEIGVANWLVAPVVARLLIGLEFFTGLLLISCFNLRRFTLPLTIGILIFFTIYLAVQLILNGNSGNCGCFGEHLYMTPFQAIIKNVIMIALCSLVFYCYAGWKTRLSYIWLLFAAVTSAVVPFALNPVDYTYSSNNLDEEVNYALGIDNLYNNSDSGKVQVPAIDLRQGKHVVAFLSLSCSHCKVAAKKFYLIKKNNPQLPLYFVLNGDSIKYQQWVAETKAGNIPYSFCLGKTFVQLAGTRLPRIYYLEDGIVIKKVDYFELNQYDIETWLEAD